MLDGGYPTTAPMIMASIAKLGFDIKDVKALPNSNPRPDQGGGLAVLQQASGAELWASEASADVIASGGDDPDRPAAEDARPDRPRSAIRPRGSTTGSRTATRSVSGRSRSPRTSPAAARVADLWSFPVRDDDRVLNVVSACGLGCWHVAVSGTSGRHRAQLRVLRSLPADIWVTQHGRRGAATAVRRKRHGEEPG